MTPLLLIIKGNLTGHLISSSTKLYIVVYTLCNKDVFRYWCVIFFCHFGQPLYVIYLHMKEKMKTLIIIIEGLFEIIEGLFETVLFMSFHKPSLVKNWDEVYTCHLVFWEVYLFYLLHTRSWNSVLLNCGDGAIFAFKGCSTI